MKIKTRSIQNPGIDIVELVGNMNARESEEIKEFLFNCLDKGKDFHLINFAHVKKIDGLGINTICYFINRGMRICLFNVDAEIRGMLKLAGKDDIIKIINETEIDKAISEFENELLEKKDSTVDSQKRRLHTRIEASFPAGFKYYDESSEIVAASANILNLSVEGMLAGEICITDTGTGGYGDQLCLKGLDLHDITFKLNGNQEVVETRGKCVWESNGFDNYSAGIYFNEIDDENRNRISKYINKSISTEE